MLGERPTGRQQLAKRIHTQAESEPEGSQKCEVEGTLTFGRGKEKTGRKRGICGSKKLRGRKSSTRMKENGRGGLRPVVFKVKRSRVRSTILGGGILENDIRRRIRGIPRPVEFIQTRTFGKSPPDVWKVERRAD